jgi:hypothetical protein
MLVSLQFLNLRQSVGLFGRGISPLQGRYLTQTQNKHIQTSMSPVEFEPTIPVFERAKTFHALDRAATVRKKKVNYPPGWESLESGTVKYSHEPRGTRTRE